MPKNQAPGSSFQMKKASYGNKNARHEKSLPVPPVDYDDDVFYDQEDIAKLIYLSYGLSDADASDHGNPRGTDGNQGGHHSDEGVNDGQGQYSGNQGNNDGNQGNSVEYNSNRTKH